MIPFPTAFAFDTVVCQNCIERSLWLAKFVTYCYSTCIVAVCVIVVVSLLNVVCRRFCVWYDSPRMCFLFCCCIFLVSFFSYHIMVNKDEYKGPLGGLAGREVLTENHNPNPNSAVCSPSGFTVPIPAWSPSQNLRSAIGRVGCDGVDVFRPFLLLPSARQITSRRRRREGRSVCVR